jgi:hypothetical protein
MAGGNLLKGRVKYKFFMQFGLFGEDINNFMAKFYLANELISS